MPNHEHTQKATEDTDDETLGDLSDDTRSKASITGAPGSMSEAHEAFMAIMPDLGNIPRIGENYRPVELGYAITTAIGTAKAIQPYLGRLAELPFYDMRAVEGLERTANALMWADAQQRLQRSARRKVPELVEKAREQRTLLMLAAKVGIATEVLSRADLSDIGGARSHRDLGLDLIRLSAMLNQTYDRLEGKIPFTPDSLREASDLGQDLLAELGYEGGVVDEIPEDLRNLAIRLLLYRYDEVRRGIRFLRHEEGDASAICPSLYLRTSAASSSKSGGAAPSGGTTDPRNDVTD